MIIVNGIRVRPSTLKNVAAEFAPRTTGVIRIILDEPGPDVSPPLRVRFEHRRGLNDAELDLLRHEIEQRISDVLSFRPLVELIPVGGLGKARRKSQLLVRPNEGGDVEQTPFNCRAD